MMRLPWVSRAEYERMASIAREAQYNAEVRKAQVKDLRRATHRLCHDINTAANTIKAEAHKGFNDKAKEMGS